MADNQWVFDLETNIFSNVVTIAKPKLQKKYKSMNFEAAFTTVEKNLDKDPVFPTIYIHELPGVEKGQVLDGASINAVQETIQVDVITNTKQSDAKGILAIISETFKKMQFQIISMPEFKNDNEKRFRSTARFRRVIGSNERLI